MADKELGGVFKMYLLYYFISIFDINCQSFFSLFWHHIVKTFEMTCCERQVITEKEDSEFC